MREPQFARICRNVNSLTGKELCTRILGYQLSGRRILRGSGDSGDPAGARQRNPRHGGRFQCQSHQVFAFQVVHVRFAAGPRQGRQFHLQHLQVISQLLGASLGRKTLLEYGILGGNSDRALPALAVVAEARSGIKAGVILGSVMVRASLDLAVMVTPQGDEHSLADGDGIGAKRQCFGDVGTTANSARNDELNFIGDVQFLKRLDCQR